MKRFGIFGAFNFLAHIGECLAEEARTAASGVVNRLANLWVDHLHDGADERTGRIVFAAVASCVTHALDFVLIEQGHLVLVLGTAEVQRVDEVDHLAQVVAAGDFVAQLGEDLADFILQRVGAAGGGLKLTQLREEPGVDKLLKVGTCHAVDVVGCAIGLLGCSPLAPAQESRDDAFVFPASHQGVHLAFGLQVVEVFEEEQP